MMTVQDAIKSFTERGIGYVRMISYEVAGGEAKERTLDTFSNVELIDCLDNSAIAYYTIGSYGYIIYKEG